MGTLYPEGDKKPWFAFVLPSAIKVIFTPAPELAPGQTRHRYRDDCREFASPDTEGTPDAGASGQRIYSDPYEKFLEKTSEPTPAESEAAAQRYDRALRTKQVLEAPYGLEAEALNPPPPSTADSEPEIIIHSGGFDLPVPDSVYWNRLTPSEAAKSQLGLWAYAESLKRAAEKTASHEIDDLHPAPGVTLFDTRAVLDEVPVVKVPRAGQASAIPDLPTAHSKSEAIRLSCQTGHTIKYVDGPDDKTPDYSVSDKTVEPPSNKYVASIHRAACASLNKIAERLTATIRNVHINEVLHSDKPLYYPRWEDRPENQTAAAAAQKRAETIEQLGEPFPLEPVDSPVGQQDYKAPAAKCEKCGGPVKQTGHGPYCPKATCKWGWEMEMDGSPLKPPVSANEIVDSMLAGISKTCKVTFQDSEGRDVAVPDSPWTASELHATIAKITEQVAKPSKADLDLWKQQKINVELDAMAFDLKLTAMNKVNDMNCAAAVDAIKSCTIPAGSPDPSKWNQPTIQGAKPEQSLHLYPRPFYSWHDAELDATRKEVRFLHQCLESLRFLLDKGLKEFAPATAREASHCAFRYAYIHPASWGEIMNTWSPEYGYNHANFFEREDTGYCRMAPSNTRWFITPDVPPGRVVYSNFPMGRMENRR